MRSNYNWNPVFNLIMELKDEMISTNQLDYTKHEGNLTCVEAWAQKSSNKIYSEIFKSLEINQFNYFVLIRYAQYSRLYDLWSSEAEITELWDAYNGIYRECRSIVIDVKNENIVVAPFQKFFNLNEREETSLEAVSKLISNAKVVEISEKLDGSMQSATWYNNELFISGSQAISTENSFRLHWGKNFLLEHSNYLNMIADNPNWTFIFEMISLKDAHVVCYSKQQEGMYLIGIRDKITGEQFDYAFVHNIGLLYNIDFMPQIYNQTLAEVISELDKYSGQEREGVVLYIDGFMVKLKYNDYVVCHRVLSLVSAPNLVIRKIADNDFDDYYSKIPQAYKGLVKSIYQIIMEYIINKKTMIQKAITQAQEVLGQDYNDRKTFMMWVNNGANVKADIRSYVISEYLGKSYNLLKKQLKSTTPHYMTLQQLGLQKQYEDILKG